MSSPPLGFVVLQVGWGFSITSRSYSGFIVCQLFYRHTGILARWFAFWFWFDGWGLIGGWYLIIISNSGGGIHRYRNRWVIKILVILLSTSWTNIMVTNNTGTFIWFNACIKIIIWFISQLVYMLALFSYLRFYLVRDQTSTTYYSSWYSFNPFLIVSNPNFIPCIEIPQNFWAGIGRTFIFCVYILFITIDY